MQMHASSRAAAAGRTPWPSCQQQLQLHHQRTSSRLLRRVRVAAGASATDTAASVPLPTTADAMVAQAVAAINRASAAGSRRQIVELLNPVNEKAINFMAVDAMDYPCSNMKEFESIVGLAKALLQGVLGPGTELKVTRIDEGGLDGDLAATVTAAGKAAVAVVWPTAEKLPLLKELAKDPAIQLLLVVNPLWKTEGTLVSEFGIGPWRKANEEFVGSFERSYQHYEQRIGAPSSVDVASGTRYANGAILRVVRSYPEPWVAHAVSADASSQAIGATPDRPNYKQLETLVNQGRQAKLEIFAVARAASSLDREAGVKPDAGDAAENGSGGGGSSGSFYSTADIQAMDAKQVRRVLVGLGLPGAGTPQKLVQRALAVAAAVEAGESLATGVETARKLR